MKKSATLPASGTDWARLEAMGEDEIDLDDIPEITPEMFAAAVVRKGLKPVERKTQVTLRLDREVLDWFRDQGKGYQTRINQILRAYKEAQERASR